MVVDLYKSVAKVERNKSGPMKANPSDAVRSCIIIIAILKIIMKTQYNDRDNFSKVPQILIWFSEKLS